MNPDNPTFRTEAEEKRAEEYKRLVEENTKLKRERDHLQDQVSRIDRAAVKYDSDYLNRGSRSVADGVTISLATLYDLRNPTPTASVPDKEGEDP